MLPLILVLAALTLPFSVSGVPVTGKTCIDFTGGERIEGDSWQCEDGCNTCGCRGGEITSSLVFCPGKICTDHNGVKRSHGDSWQCEDGCNTCSCNGGSVVTTLILCQEPPPPGLSCTDHTGVERNFGESWECEDECNTCTCDRGRIIRTEMFCGGPPPPDGAGFGGGLEITDISDEVIQVAKSAVSLLGGTEAVVGDGGCTNVELVEVVKAKTQVVAGTNYFLTLRLATNCPGQKEERLCENVGIFEPLSFNCENPGGCLELITPHHISCRFFSPDWYFVTVDGPPPGEKNGPSPGEVDGPPPGEIDGPPPIVDDCSEDTISEICSCPRDLAPVCAGGVIYDNLCTYQCEKKEAECVGEQRFPEVATNDLECFQTEPEQQVQDSEGSCLFSHDCLTNGGSCSYIQDASCVCNFGRCKVRGFDLGQWNEGVQTRTKECSTYKDCQCRNQTDTCFCIEGQCVSEAWECHADNDCYILNKCNGKQCTCIEATCDWQCNTNDDCIRNNEAFYCQHDNYECRCENGQCDSVISELDDSGLLQEEEDLGIPPPIIERFPEPSDSCTFSHECLGDAGYCSSIQDATCVCNFGKCLVRGLAWHSGLERTQECSTHQDCPCRNEAEKCFCIDGDCVTEAWECHDDIECSNLEKCDGKQCTCSGGTCEWQCDTTEDCTNKNDAVYCQHLGWECKCSAGQCDSVQMKEECVEPPFGSEDRNLIAAGLTACVDLGKCTSDAPCQCLQNYCSVPWYVEEGGNCREESGSKDCTDAILDCSDGSCECENIRQIDDYTRMGFCARPPQ